MYSAKLRKINITAIALCSSLGFAQNSAAEARLSLSDLQNTKVYSASKKEETVQESASAAYVLTGEEIRRSGVTSIMDALRLVPGLGVARSSTSKWSISSRGFNDRFANKLLVMVDGRSIYTHQFSGVYWEVLDPILDDIDRVEVIRGPGAALWGANAVNGVINIITKDSSYTQKDLLSLTAGNYHKAIAEGRYSDRINDNTTYKVYGKHSKRGQQVNLTRQPLHNDWSTTSTGFRLDSKEPEQQYSIITDAYYSETDFELRLPDFNAPYSINIDETGNLSGSSMVFKLEKELDPNIKNNFQASVDFNRRSFSNIENKIVSVDTDFQQTISTSENNEVVWGLGLRSIWDSLKGSDTLINISYDPEVATEQVANAYIQNEYAIAPNELKLTLGSKFEHNDYTGFEVQPSTRLAWTPNEENTVWGAISRAVRVPSRSEKDLFLVVGAVQNVGYITWNGSNDSKSEELIAYELGYRNRALENVYVDLALFYNDYSNLKTYELGPTNVNDAFTYYANSLGAAKSWGAELLTDYQATPDWKLIAGYTYLKLTTEIEPGSTDTFLEKDEGKSPSHQLSLRSHYNLGSDIEFDNTFFYTSALEAIKIDAYTRFDTRLAYLYSRDTEISLVGQNLFDSYHQEFSNAVNESASLVGRTFYLNTKVRF